MYPREFGCGVFLGCPRCVLTRWYHHAVQTCLCKQPVNLSWHHNEWLLLLTTQECGRVLLRYFSKTFFVKVLFQCCTRGTSTPKAFIVALFCRSFSLWSSSSSLWLPQLPHKHTRTHHRLRLSTHAGFMGSLYLSHSMCSSSPSGHKSSRHQLEQLCLRFIDEAISHIKTLFLKLNTFDVHDVICRIQLYVTVYASCTHTQIQGRCCKRVQ